MEKMMENSPHHRFLTDPQAVTGKVIVVEVDGIDMKKLSVNFFL
jgi:hypothetical protein